MALLLTLCKRDDVFIADTRFVVTRVRSASEFDLQNDATGQTFRISDMEVTEVLPEVLVSAGVYPGNGQVCLIIEAPRKIGIVRGSVLRKEECAQKSTT